MNKLSISLKIGLGFIIILALFAGVSVLSLRNMQEADTNSEWVDHTYLVINNINQISSNLKDLETGQRGFIITGDEHYLDPYNAAVLNIDINISELNDLTSDNVNQQQRIAKLISLKEEKLAEMKETIKLRRETGFDAAKAIVITDLGKRVMGEIRLLLKEMSDEETRLLDERLNMTNISKTKSRKMIIWFPIAAGIIVLLQIIYFTRILAIPIQTLSSVAERISVGDLTVKTKDSVRADEMGVLERAIKKMSVNLRKQVFEISEGVNVLSSSASEIMASVAQLASGSAETATSIAETTSTIAEVKQTAEISNLKASKISDNSQKNIQLSDEGTNSIEEAIGGMNRIKEQMTSIADTVIRLSEQSLSIGEIVNSVNDLAEQSNLLAVNASIEAAKAGEEGKGFGVVAQEIKNLASRSKDATNQIKLIINDIQKSISSSVIAAEQGGKAVDEGLKLSTKAGDVINIMAESLDEAAQAAIQIASSSQQQLIGMDQINEAMEGLKEASLQTAASTKQTEESIGELHKFGENLQDMLKQYKLD